MPTAETTEKKGIKPLPAKNPGRYKLLFSNSRAKLRTGFDGSISTKTTRQQATERLKELSKK